MKKRRIREFGINIGDFQTGKLNKITDVKGVTVGHSTIDTAENKTGVTVIIPCKDNVFTQKIAAASYVLNGFGKTLGLLQVNELGTLETPIALTNTLNVGLVHDALVEYTIGRCLAEKTDVKSINAVVGETNDGFLNNICHRVINKENVLSAIDACERDFEEGDVGAGKGTVCYGFKGGIGSASRVFKIGDKAYTMGVLVQSNFGKTDDLIIAGKPVGSRAANFLKNQATEKDQGSIMVIMATDIPLSSRQIRRILKRGAIGLARTGSFMGNSSGDVFIGFSTSNRIDNTEESPDICKVSIINEKNMDIAFRAMIECTEESVLNSMSMARALQGYKGHKAYPLGDFLDLELSK